MGEYVKLTEEVIRKHLEDIFFGDFEAPEGFDLDFQIKDGYSYKITSSSSGKPKIVAVTSSGGAREYVNTCREQGLPDKVIADSILVYSETDGRYHNLLNVVWKSIKK